MQLNETILKVINDDLTKQIEEFKTTQQLFNKQLTSGDDTVSTELMIHIMNEVVRCLEKNQQMLATVVNTN